MYVTHSNSLMCKLLFQRSMVLHCPNLWGAITLACVTLQGGLAAVSLNRPYNESFGPRFQSLMDMACIRGFQTITGTTDRKIATCKRYAWEISIIEKECKNANK